MISPFNDVTVQKQLSFFDPCFPMQIVLCLSGVRIHHLLEALELDGRTGGGLPYVR